MKGPALLLACASLATAFSAGTVGRREPALRPPEAFAGIPNRHDRSLALFAEASRVIMGPRCTNCHPVSRRPTQGDDGHPHVPAIDAGAAGTPPCAACHHPRNTTVRAGAIESIPGDPHWMLAPPEMAWQGKSAGEICRQIKDVRRNGGRSLAQLHQHMAEDGLVGWAWHHGAGRTPAPGSQVAFGRLVAAWIESGAACPESRTRSERSVPIIR